MNDECDCGLCGRCAEQQKWQWELESRKGWHCDYYSDDKPEEDEEHDDQ